MGQYYKAIMQKGKGKITVFNRNVIVGGKEERTFAKLTEHSWWYNAFVNAVCEIIVGNPQKIAWIGDYARDYLSYHPEGINGITRRQINTWHRMAWREEKRDTAVNTTNFILNDMYLVNHSKKLYIDGTAYYKRCVMQEDKYGGWCLHPLPILTCIGNGLGGGDYNNPTDDSDTSFVGAWAFDVLSVEEIIPEDYQEIELTFKERGWEK